MPDPLKSLADTAIQLNRGVAKAVSDVNVNLARASETAIQGIASLTPAAPSISSGQGHLSIPLSPLTVIPEVFGVASDTLTEILGGKKDQKKKKQQKKRGRKIGPIFIPLSEEEISQADPEEEVSAGNLSESDIASADDVDTSGDVRIH